MWVHWPDSFVFANTVSSAIELCALALQPDGLRDILPPVLPEPAPKWPLYAGAALAVLALSALAGYVRQRKRGFDNSIPARTPAMPHEIALRGLDALGSDDPSIVCENVSAILRTYIAARFGVWAPQSATDELLERLLTVSHFEPANRQKLQELFAACDLVKYAGRRLLEGELRELVQGCREWVWATRLEILPTDAAVLFR